jgi:hypothetical protein
MSDLEKQYEEVLARLAVENKQRDHAYPTGFWKSHGALSGVRQGYGFYCPTCKLLYVAHAPAEVRHCGRTTAMPTGWLAPIKKFRMRHFKLLARFA